MLVETGCLVSVHLVLAYIMYLVSVHNVLGIWYQCSVLIKTGYLVSVHTVVAHIMYLVSVHIVLAETEYLVSVHIVLAHMYLVSVYKGLGIRYQCS